MLFFLVSCLSFLLLSNSLFLNLSSPHSKPDSRMWGFWKVLQRFWVLISRKKRVFSVRTKSVRSNLSARFLGRCYKDEEEGLGFSLLDLPDLALDCILEKVLPAELCRMSIVCSLLREKCTSGHLWEHHLRQKWGRVIGDVALKEWQLSQSQRPPKSEPPKFMFKFLGLKSQMERNKQCCRPVDTSSVMSLYMALESGKFWFPAQVFNREDGHVGFMLSCYDAKLSYDSTRDNFVARYPAQGRSVIEEGINWNKIRATPSVEIPPNVVHVSECLDDLQPDNHIEIQWRKNKNFPYGWWYGVVGHVDSCGGNHFNCLCPFNDTVVLEFKQYKEGSRWRRVMISRRDHREVGNEAVGFYAGIRKLSTIGEWKYFWPNCALE